MIDAFSQPFPIDDDDNRDQTTSPGGSESVKWEVIARMPGLPAAQIVAGRLNAEGIPARIWQEGAGRALGLTVGILGTGYVTVPQEYVAQAQEILDQDPDWENEDEIN